MKMDIKNSGCSPLLFWFDSLNIRLLQIILVSITAVVCWQVFSRYVLAEPSSITEELSRFLLIWLTVLGAAYAYRKRSHLGLDIIYNQGTALQRKVMYLMIHMSIALFALCVMVFGGIRLVLMTYELGQKSAVMGIDIGLVYMVLPISGLLILIYALNFMFSYAENSEPVL
ncbi:TRAP transporter small permease [Paraglaciecola sp.]|uniref:TRAP transporter small permease n=1 Tax=Paraglaciecola sp. TaxID=1920173 RepID=UPI003264D43D